MFPVVKMCKVLKVSTSGYYKWLKQVPSKRKQRRKMLLEAIQVVYNDSKKIYGSPRITAELQKKNIVVSKVLVAKIMKQNNIRSIIKKRYKVTTDSSHKYPVAANVLNRNFTTKAQNKDYVSIYKTMMGGGIEQNVVAYNSLLFSANTVGASSVKITLIKKSITNWNDQYSYTATVNDSKDFAIALNSFKSSKFNTAINANDITAVNFSFITARNTATNMTVNLSKVRFSTATANTASSETLNVVSVYPNPTMGRFTTTFTSNSAQPLVLKVTDVATSRVVKTQFIGATKEENIHQLNVENVVVNGMYIITISGDNRQRINHNN
jgi:hypothetical protein